MKNILIVPCVCILSACHSSSTPPQSQVPIQEIRSVIVDSPKDNNKMAQKSDSTKRLSASYLIWLNHPDNARKVQDYESFLKLHQVNKVVPHDQLFRTARDWQKCMQSEYEVPPRELWSNLIPTLKILKLLVDQKVIHDFEVTSVYRNINLNKCAGGADSSRHIFNTAIDFRIGQAFPDDQDLFLIEQSKEKLCEFWHNQGEQLNMGLGVYASGQIHIDSLGYRTWGPDHKQSSSICKQ